MESSGLHVKDKGQKGLGYHRPGRTTSYWTEREHQLCQLQALFTTLGHYAATIQESKEFFLDCDSKTTTQPITLLGKVEYEMREQGCFYVVQLGKAEQG